MSQLTIPEIFDIATALDTDFWPLRDQARDRYSLYRLKKDPYVPEEIAREGKVRVLSEALIYAASTIRADIMMNPTEFTCIPLARERDGAIPRKLEGKAENLERSDAVIWGRLDEGRKIDREQIYHQLISPFGVMILEFNDLVLPDQPEWMSDSIYADLVDAREAEWMPWSIYQPDPMTCSWMERDGRPAIFARKYKVLVRDLEAQYSQSRASVEPEAYLRMDNEGRFRWSDDYLPIDRHRYAGGFAEVEVWWLDDGQYVYQVALNPTVSTLVPNQGKGGSGLLLSAQPNPIGRPTGFVVPGNTTPARDLIDRYEPYLLPLMQHVNKINDLRSMRATAARNLAGPHTYVAIDPEIAKIYAQRNEKLPVSVRWRKNETHYLLGEVKEMPSELSPDWDKLEQILNEEGKLYMPTDVNSVDPAVLKAATATSILHAAESTMRKYGPMMSSYDGAIRDILEAIHTSVRTYYPDLNLILHATGDEVARGVALTAGSVYNLNAEAVAFPFKLSVKTRGMSQAQASAQYDLALRQWTLPDGSRGPATMDDLIDAANYTDRVAQKMKLAKEGIVQAADPWIQQMAIMLVQQKVKMESGIDLPIGGQQPGGAPGAAGGANQPASIPGGAQSMSTPLIAGPGGGTNPTLGPGAQG